MFRPAHLVFNKQALEHNFNQIKTMASQQQIVAMVKANAYGVGVKPVIEVLQQKAYAFGVATIDEALGISAQYPNVKIVLFEGVFNQSEYQLVAHYAYETVIHQIEQLNWLLEKPLSSPIKVWLKINTGMNRLGFKQQELLNIYTKLTECSWVQKPINIMSHFASADAKDSFANQQLQSFLSLQSNISNAKWSMANSAAILNYPDSHLDYVRPGILLYGISPLDKINAEELGFKPVIQFKTKITAIQHISSGETVGYGATWRANRDSRIAIVAVGYGDGYPRHVNSDAKVFINDAFVPIVGRVSMDMLTIDVTDYPDIKIADEVELWGDNLTVESVAQFANTIPYELSCQILSRVKNSELI